MKNVTITLDEQTADWARVHAAKAKVSLSRFVGEVLRRHMRESREYDRAMNRYLNSTLVIRRQPGERASREELHDRAALRKAGRRGK
jgi:hypothetical protein